MHGLKTTLNALQLKHFKRKRKGISATKEFCLPKPGTVLWRNASLP
jgi:hypothetical protein